MCAEKAQNEPPTSLKPASDPETHVNPDGGGASTAGESESQEETYVNPDGG